MFEGLYARAIGWVKVVFGVGFRVKVSSRNPIFRILTLSFRATTLSNNTMPILYRLQQRSLRSGRVFGADSICNKKASISINGEPN